MPRVNQLSGEYKNRSTLAHNISIPANTTTRPETAKFSEDADAGPPSVPLFNFARGVGVGVVDGTGVIVVLGVGLTLVGLYAD